MDTDKGQYSRDDAPSIEYAKKARQASGKLVDVDSKKSKELYPVGDFGRRHRGISLEHVETVSDKSLAKPSKKQKIKRHCGRFWCCYLIALIIFLAIFLPLFFLKIIPAVAQLVVNNTPLPIKGGAILAYSPTELQISLSSDLNIPAGLTVDLDTIDLYLYNTNATVFSPYAKVNIPGLRVHGDTPINIDEEVVGITNETELIGFLNDVFASRTTTLSARGNTTAHLGALNAHVTLDKSIEINALNNLDGFGLKNPQLILPADPDGTNIIGNLSLPNWSDLTLGLGNVTLNALAGDLIIGKVSVFNVLIPPGNNSLPFRGEIFLPVILSNLGEVIMASSDALKRGAIAIGASGNSTIVNGEHITYLESVLNTKHLVTEIPILQLLGDVLGGLLSGNSSSGLLGAIEQALNSSGLLDALAPFLKGLNITQADEIYRREVLGELI